jgi:holo-[acyl-carrier protein] synthase
VIAGIGADIVHIDRVKKVLDRYGDRFVNRILTPEERVRYGKTKAKASHLAKRFAAKEAFSKAIGTGIRSPFRWHSVTVARDSWGKPLLKPDLKMAEYLAKNGVTHFHVSLTDDADVAMAFVVLEALPPLASRLSPLS